MHETVELLYPTKRLSHRKGERISLAFGNALLRSIEKMDPKAPMQLS